MKGFVSMMFASALALTLAVPAEAQVQTKNQQGCLNKVIKSARKVHGAVLKDAVACVKKGAKGNLPVTPQACLGADLKGKVAKARAKVASTITKTCSATPDFGLTDEPTIGDAYVADNRGLSIDAFGTDLGATLVASAGDDPGGKCSATLPGGLRKLEDAMHKEMEACIKNGLKAKTLIDVGGIEDCLDSIVADAKNKVGKATAGLQKLLTTKCPAGDLDTMFPGLVSVCGVYGRDTNAAGLSLCGQDRLKCRVCRIFNDAYGLARDCDEFDDGNLNGSCPECGNGVTDSGEECDDGNDVDGDGCTSECFAEFCGDGIINNNGVEDCDDGPLNSDTAPNACRSNCTHPVCGDGVTDLGEECDDGNTIEDDGCTNACTSCGNGIASGAEECDDGNNVDGDCCSAACTFESYGSACTGPDATACTAPGCDGAGTCAELPANEGDPCDDGDECSNSSSCDAGTCTADSYVITGVGCRWMAVASPGAGNRRRLQINNGVQTSGPMCGNYAEAGTNAILGADLVTTTGDATTDGVLFTDSSTNVNAADVVTNNARVRAVTGTVPGLGVGTVAAGQLVSKMPAGVYDTTGTDPRVTDCQAAQTAIATSATALDALPSTHNYGSTFNSITGGDFRTVDVPMHGTPGGLNVFDFTAITGGNNVTLNIDGGNDPGTVVVMRINSGNLNTSQSWTWNLTGGLTPSRLLIYGKNSTNSACEIGESNTGGGGTLFCPNGRITIKIGSNWTGAAFGGGSSPEAIQLNNNIVFTHQRFTGF